MKICLPTPSANSVKWLASSDEIASERLTAAVERSSADRMRSLEATQGDQWVSTKNKRSDIPFVRTASSGLWKEKLPVASIVEIEAAWAS